MSRIYSIDYLRAFFSVCVVITHTGYYSTSKIFDKNLFLHHSFAISDIFVFYILLLAVPVFFIISNFFLYQKQKSLKDFFAYLLRLFKVALFLFFFLAIFSNNGWEFINTIPTEATKTFDYILPGGNTIYYFFINLIILSIIVQLSKSLHTQLILILFIISILQLLFLPVYCVNVDQFYPCRYYNILNFTPYPFAAILIHNLISKDHLKIKTYIYLILFITTIMIIIDWTIYVDSGFFKINKFALPTYARPSLFFISMLILVLAIKIPFKPNTIISFMSSQSLALYCLHPFFMGPAKRLADGNLLIALSIILPASYITSICLTHFLKKEIIN